MTLMSSISKLTISVDQLAGEANVTKAQLDAKVTLADAAVVATQAEQAAIEGARDEAAVHTADAATHLATVKADVSYEGIGAILAEKAVTAVDVFVYDTSLDSDGGAWRKRCQHTSWYNEPINTATRGARREFPAVSVIVAEAGTLTIYDGDDPSLPMWMVFRVDGNTNGSQPILGRNSNNIKCVTAKNGTLAVGCEHVVGFAGGLRRVIFLSDEAFFHSSTSPETGRYAAGIAERNNISSFGFDGLETKAALIAGRTVIDVAMTVLPNAPIDPATGLPVPTIAVATDDGISVIREDGNVWDIRNLDSADEATFVGFTDDGRIFAQLYDDNRGLRFFEIPDTADILQPNHYTRGMALEWYGDVVYGNGDLQMLGLATSGPRLSDSQRQRAVAFRDNIARGAIGGLSHVARNKTKPTKGMVAYTHPLYTTGWMPGAIRGAFLSDTDDTDLVGGELVTNGTFDTATDWTFTSNDPDFLIEGGQLVQKEPTSGSVGAAHQTLNGIKAGNAVYFEVDQASFDVAGVRVMWSSTLEIRYVNAIGVTAFTAIAPTDNPTLRLEHRQNNTFAINSISAKLAEADRSVNKNGLIVNGTITRSPVADGAELVGYAGGGSNYLSRDFAGAYTGYSSFTLIGWYFGGTAGFWDWHETVGGGSSAAHLDTYMDPTTKNFRLVWQNRTSIILQGDGPSIEGRWVQIALCLTGSGGLQFYQDGRLIKTYTTVPSAALHELRVLPAGGSKMALLRLTETIPTADQIAKIYEDERKLFMPGAQCTLHGTSDAVTALAHDPKTNLLHVGTNQGRSVFDGLQRVANTETPVGTAIAAVNGLIAEQ